MFLKHWLTYAEMDNTTWKIKDYKAECAHIMKIIEALNVISNASKKCFPCILNVIKACSFIKNNEVIIKAYVDVTYW